MTHHRSCGRSETTAPAVGTVAVGVTVLVLATAFSLHALDVAWAWVVYPLGFGGLLPLAMGAAARARRDESSRSRQRPVLGERHRETREALDELRLRYARGEIDEETFERRVERVLETEAVDDADAYGPNSSGGETPSARTTRSR